MKRITAILLLSTLALLTVTTSCKKYEDGPALSLLTKKQRLCRKWLVKSISTGGFSLEDSSSNYTYDFQKDGTATVTEDNASVTGSWAFANDKEDLVITGDNISQTFEIRRLTNKELWLKYDDDSSDTEYILKLEEIN